MGKVIRVSQQTLKVLAALAEKPAGWHYGYALSRQTELLSGTLYPILMRLEKHGWLETHWENPPPGGRPPRHMYRLTAGGRKRAAEKVQSATRRGAARLVPQRVET